MDADGACQTGRHDPIVDFGNRKRQTDRGNRVGAAHVAGAAGPPGDLYGDGEAEEADIENVRSDLESGGTGWCRYRSDRGRMPVKNKCLLVFLNDCQVGRLIQRGGVRTFLYEDVWREMPEAFPISLSMPLSRSVYHGAVVDRFLWGLLPDNVAVLRQWGRAFRVSERNPFALLSCMGLDCAGALRFVREGEEHLLDQTGIEWLEPEEVEVRLGQMRECALGHRSALPDVEQFSLAGAQAKLALYREHGKWGIPKGKNPTTHISHYQTGFHFSRWSCRERVFLPAIGFCRWNTSGQRRDHRVWQRTGVGCPTV